MSERERTKTNLVERTPILSVEASLDDQDVRRVGVALSYSSHDGDEGVLFDCKMKRRRVSFRVREKSDFEGREGRTVERTRVDKTTVGEDMAHEDSKRVGE